MFPNAGNGTGARDAGTPSEPAASEVVIFFLHCECILLLPVVAVAGTIACTHAPDGGEPWPVNDVYSMRGDGSSVKALTSDGHSHHPSWSPDGRRTLFIHDAALRAKPAYREQPGFETHHPVELWVILKRAVHLVLEQGNGYHCST